MVGEAEKLGSWEALRLKSGIEFGMFNRKFVSEPHQLDLPSFSPSCLLNF
jgi:hypothetical protein